MSQILIKNMTFGYEGSSENVFENVNLNLDSDWKIGLFGRNGTGKSTLFSLLAGRYDFRGEIRSGVRFELYPKRVKNTSAACLDVLPEFGEAELWKTLVNMEELGLSAETLAKRYETLSEGEKAKLALAVMFAKENNFLLIDEQTNHLDLRGRELAAEFLNRQKGFMLITHDRTFADRCVDHVVYIMHTKIVLQKGGMSDWLRENAARDNAERAENERLKKEIVRLREGALRAKGWGEKTEKSKNAKISGVKPDKGYIGHKAAKMMQTAKNIERRREKAAEAKENLLKDVETAYKLKVSAGTAPGGALVSMKSVNIYYGDFLAAKGVDFTIEKGEKVALIGANGSGKSTVLKLAAGKTLQYEGIFVRKNVKVSYVAQSSESAAGTLAEYAAACGADYTRMLTILRKMGFSRELFCRRVESYSDGQKKKTMLAASLSGGADLFIWDEPLNYLDITARLQIEELVKESAAAMLFVEHDKAFVGAAADKIVELK